MEKSELKECKKYLLLCILMYFMIMLFVCRLDIKEIFSHFLFSMVMGAIWYFILVKILGFIAGVFKIGADATVYTIVSTKQYFDEQKEK